MIKTIIFDIGGVITHMDFETLYSNFALRIGISPEFVSEYHKKNIQALILGNISLADFWIDMKNAGADPDLDYKKIWIEEGMKIRTIDQDLLNMIGVLRKNYSVGTLTNLSETRFILDEAIHLYDNFDYHVLSFKEHMEKPNPEFYKIALARVAIRAEESVFIDDQEKCMPPAIELGMNTILYSDKRQLTKALRALGVVE